MPKLKKYNNLNILNVKMNKSKNKNDFNNLT